MPLLVLSQGYPSHTSRGTLWPGDRLKMIIRQTQRTHQRATEATKVSSGRVGTRSASEGTLIGDVG